MGRHLVLLPGPDDVTFYERIAGKKGTPATLSGKQLSWPTSPELLFDFDRRITKNSI
jgi:hypothetical protein